MSKDTALYAISKAIPALAGIALVPLLLRTMSHAEYADFGQSMALVNAFVGFGAGWLNQAQLRFVGQPDGGAAHSAALWGAVLSALVGAVGISWWRVLHPAGTLWGECFLYFCMLAGLMAITGEQARQRATTFMWLESGRIVVLLAAFGFALLMVKPLTGPVVILCFALSYLFAPLVRISALWGTPEARIRWDDQVRRRLWALWRFGWPVGAWIGVTSLMQVADRTLISQRLGPAAATGYIASFEIYFRGLSLALFPLVMAAHPELVRRWNGGDGAGTRSLAGKVLCMQVGASLVLIALVALVAPTVSGLFGIPDNATASTAIWLSLAAALWQAALIAHKPFELMQRTRLMLGCACVAMLVFAAVLWVGIDHGPTYVAAAHVVSGLSYLALCLWFGWLRLRD